MIRIIIARVFRLLFKFSFFEKRFFGFHKRFFAPKNIFQNIVQTVKFKGYIKMELHIGDWIQENIYFLDKYEEAELIYLKSSLKKGNVFIDIGANIGVYSLFSSSILGQDGRVISFEPFSKNYNLFKKNISLNNYQNIQAEKIAISDMSNDIEIYYDEEETNLGMASSYATNSYTISETVKATTLDDYINDKNISSLDFIKIDIEGGEFKAVQGMIKTLKSFYPKLLVEILDDTKDKESLVKLLDDIGYKKFFIKNNGEISEKETNPNRKNFVFIKR